MVGEITEYTEPWNDHCLESDYGSTTVQINIVGRSLRLTQYSQMCVLRGKEFGVCNWNTQKDQGRGIGKKRNMRIGVLNCAAKPPIYRGQNSS